MKKLCDENCEGVIKILEVIEDDVCVYIVMERLGGCSESADNEGVLKTMDLFTYIDTRAPTPSITLSIFVSVARTLRQLHSLGIVHRDIKDENILISTRTNPQTGREEVADVRLIDFGSCGIEGVQSVGKGGKDVKGREWFDEYEGTVQYAPPEVLLGKVFNGRKADIWSLGILLVSCGCRGKDLTCSDSRRTSSQCSMACPHFPVLDKHSMDPYLLYVFRCAHRLPLTLSDGCLRSGRTNVQAVKTYWNTGGVRAAVMLKQQ